MTKTAPTDFYASFWSAVTQGAAPLEAFDQRVFVHERSEDGQQARIELGDRDHERLVGGDLVVTDPVAGHHASDHLEDALAVLGEVVEAVGLADEVQEQLRVGECLTAHRGSKYVR